MSENNPFDLVPVTKGELAEMRRHIAELQELAQTQSDNLDRQSKIIYDLNNSKFELWKVGNELLETVRDADMSQGASDWIENPPANIYRTDPNAKSTDFDDFYKGWVGKRRHWLDVLKGRDK